MRPVTVKSVISAPREEIFDLIADLSHRVAWTDHYTDDHRLARVHPVGLGAAIRFRVKPPLQPSVYVELSIVKADRPRRIVEEARVGRIGRTRLQAVYDLIDEGGSTRVELTTWTEPGIRFDAFKESLGVRRWLRRNARTALARLRMVFEEPPAAPLARVTIAGHEPAKNPRFGAAPR